MSGGAHQVKEVVFTDRRRSHADAGFSGRRRRTMLTGESRGQPSPPSQDHGKDIRSRSSQKGRLEAGLADATGEAVAAAAAAAEKADWKQMMREVNVYGGEALDKKGKRKFQARVLSEMGAKAAKSQRVGARIGLGMKRKAAVREKRAEEEAIASGMMQLKGKGKKKAMARKRNRDMGLQELGRGFKPGMLNVKGLRKTR